jgi:hypothetical protein
VYLCVSVAPMLSVPKNRIALSAARIVFDKERVGATDNTDTRG